MLFGDDDSFTEILAELHRIPFRYTIPMDGNREADGINLRYRFGYEHGYEDYIIAEYLDNSPCSVLEMVTALAIRCEEIMECVESNDRTGEWFWEMLVSLGLDDSSIDIHEIRDKVDSFLDREYEPNGKGGLFTVSRNCDMRSVEIWYQMQYWLGEKFIS